MRVGITGGGFAGLARCYVATPGVAALETVRNAALRVTPDSVVATAAGAVSRWRPT